MGRVQLNSAARPTGRELGTVRVKANKETKRKVSEETARVTISMMRSLAKNRPISPFHLAAADDMEALLNEVLRYRREKK